MSSTFAKKIILVGNLQGISEPVLRFGCELILTSIFGTLILIALSIIIGHPIVWLFFLMGFAPLRTTAGGYHADTHIKCYCVTSLMFLLAALTSYTFTWYRFTYASVSVFSAAFTIMFAPLAATNKPLSPKRYHSNRINSLIIISINTLFAVVFTVLNVVIEEANMYFAGIFFASASLGMGKIKKFFIRRKAQ